MKAEVILGASLIALGVALGIGGWAIWLDLRRPQPIAPHMRIVVTIEGRGICICDPNAKKPKYEWMSEAEFLKRWSQASEEHSK